MAESSFSLNPKTHPPSAPVSSPAILCRRVTVEFPGGVRPVDEIELAVPAGRLLALVGPSGCGKTTLLRVLAGLQPPRGGTVEYGSAVRPGPGGVSFVFQQPALLPWRTALENVLLPLQLAGIGTHADRRRTAETMLAEVDLADAMGRFPDQLSGGMRMRVSLARALVTSPSVLLLDEPFAALDDMLRNQLGELVHRLWRSLGFTAVMVTHNIGEAVLLSHQIAVMRHGRLGQPIDNPLPEPRGESLRRTAEFARFYGVVSDALRGDR